MRQKIENRTLIIQKPVPAAAHRDAIPPIRPHSLSPLVDSGMVKADIAQPPARPGGPDRAECCGRGFPQRAEAPAGDDGPRSTRRRRSEDIPLPLSGQITISPGRAVNEAGHKGGEAMDEQRHARVCAAVHRATPSALLWWWSRELVWRRPVTRKCSRRAIRRARRPATVCRSHPARLRAARTAASVETRKTCTPWQRL